MRQDAVFTSLGCMITVGCMGGAKSSSNDAAPTDAGSDAAAAQIGSRDAAAIAPNVSYRVAGYFPSWAAARDKCSFTATDLDPRMLTHVFFAFAKIDPGPNRRKPDFKVAPYDIRDVAKNGPVAQLNALKARCPNMKTSISIGGYKHNDAPTAWIFTSMAESASSRAQFNRSAIRYAREHGFDGIDIDWEYPVDPARGGRAVDRKNFTLLLKELRSAIDLEATESGKKPLVLTIALPAGPPIRGYELSEIHRSIDWANLMAYDYAGAWDHKTGANAPIHGHGVSDSVDVVLAAGFPNDKVVLGLATYGRSFAGVAGASLGGRATGPGPKLPCTDEPGIAGYLEVLDLLKSKKYEGHWDDATATPFLYSATDKVLIAYDDERSLQQKTNIIKTRKLGGAIFWSLDTDDYRNGYPLLRSVSKALAN